MSVSRKLHYCGSSYSPGYTSDFLGIPINLEYQFRDFSVSVLTRKMDVRIRKIVTTIRNIRLFSLNRLSGWGRTFSNFFLCLAIENHLQAIILLHYSKENRQETNSMIKIFCFFRGIEYDNSLLDILQIARSSFRKKSFLVFQMPFVDDEIGALSYRGDGIGYVVIN